MKEPEMERNDRMSGMRRARVRFIVVTVGLATVGLAGYVGFVAVVDRGVGAATMVLAAATGFAAFFSPCSFPLLLTFLARRSQESPRQAFFGALRIGVGATTFLGLVALAIAALGTAVGTVVAFDTMAGRTLRVVIGAFLILLGLRNARIFTLRIAWLDGVAGGSANWLVSGSTASPARRDFAYGFGYLLAGFG